MQISKTIFLKIILISIVLYTFCKCSTTKNKIDYNEVRKGNQLEKIPEINLDTFLTIWMSKTYDENGINVSELYFDSLYTYIWKRWNHYYKIKNDTLKNLDYKSIDGDSIRSIFWNEIIPDKDKQKSKNCMSYYSGCDFKYKYNRNENTIELYCHYKILCEMIIPIVNKEYYAKYNINSKSLLKIK